MNTFIDGLVLHWLGYRCFTNIPNFHLDVTFSRNFQSIEVINPSGANLYHAPALQRRFNSRGQRTFGVRLRRRMMTIAIICLPRDTRW